MISLSANGNPLHPTESAQGQGREDTIRAAGALGIKTVCTMFGLPSGSPTDTIPNWVVSSWPPETQSILRYHVGNLERTRDRDKAVSLKAFLRQLKAIKAWGLQAPQRLEAIRDPVLVVNGDNDIMVPSENSTELARRIPGAELVLYPDAGHGGIFQYHDTFLAKAKTFLTA